MPRKERVDALKNLEKACKSPVISYVTGDRHPAISGQIAEDAVRVIYEHLQALGSQDRINLFLYTRGGDLMAPPRIVRLIREYAKEFYALVPYRAHSAGTSICLGADFIIMGKMGELSPVDPSTVGPFNPQAVQGDPRNPQTKIPISVEDVRAYLFLSTEKANLTSEQQRIETFRALTSQVNPLALGNIQRVLDVIRFLTPELLDFQLKTPEEKIRITEITKVLTEKYTHDNLISRDLAEKIGLKVTKPDGNLESAMWSLYEAYERDLELRKVFDPEEILGDQESRRITCDVAYIETVHKGHAFSLEAIISRRVQPTPLPPTPTPMPIQPRPPITGEFDVKLKTKGWREIKGEEEEK